MQLTKDLLLSNIICNAKALSRQGENPKAISLLEKTLARDASLTQPERLRVKKIIQLLQHSRISLDSHKSVYNETNTRDTQAPKDIDWPKISIVTPTYNQADFIEDTIVSVLNQKYPNLEYIIVDGASSDNTCNIVNRYSSHITSFISEKDKGQSNAINKGMALATGEILYWLNSDDILEPETLIYVGLRYRKDQFDLLTGACTPFDHDSGKLVNRHIATCPFDLQTEDITDIEATWLKGMYFHQPEVFFSKKIWEAAGGYVNEDLYYSMDYDLWARMAISSAKGVRVCTAGKSFCLFRQHSNQKTSTTEAYLPELLSHSKTLRKQHLSKARKSNFYLAKNYRQKLFIAAISDFGFNGGAGIAHKRICQVLQAAGHEVIQLTGFQSWQSETLDLDTDGFKEALDTLRPDIVLLGNLHNLKRGLEIAEYSSLNYTTIVIAHDFWWVTGRCAYTHGCQFLFTQCTRVCPTPAEYPRLEPSGINQQHQRKKNLIANPNLHILANSSYTQDIFHQTIQAWDLRSNPVGCIPLPITPEGEEDLVLPIQLDNQYSILTSNSQVRIVLGCTDHADFRKGADLAVLALRQAMASNPDILLNVYGKNCDLILDSLPEYANRILLHGYLVNKEDYQNILEIGDIFLGTSREETLGQTFVEAAFAGLITIGPMGTGYSDVVAACRYSYGYSTTEASEIASTIEKAIELLKQADRQSIRSIQKAQAQASFSGISFLSSFNHYLYTSGIWKKLHYHCPTKIYNLKYSQQTIDEIVVCDAKALDPLFPRGTSITSETMHKDISVTIPVSEWKLGRGLYLEYIGEKAVAWLQQQSNFLIAIGSYCSCRTIDIDCHWIPDKIRQTSCVLKIVGLDSISALIPPKGNVISFKLMPHSEQSAPIPPKLLCSIAFEHSIALDDGRDKLAIICSGITLS